jgi:hypothetical protein
MPIVQTQMFNNKHLSPRSPSILYWSRCLRKRQFSEALWARVNRVRRPERQGELNIHGIVQHIFCSLKAKSFCNRTTSNPWNQTLIISQWIQSNLQPVAALALCQNTQIACPVLCTAARFDPILPARNGQQESRALLGFERSTDVSR